MTYAAYIYKVEEVKKYGLKDIIIEKVYFFMKNVLKCDLNSKKW